MVSVLGGKWTTYRKMAEDAVDQAAFIGGLVAVPSKSRDVVLAGGGEPARGPARLARYGADAARVAALETRYGADALRPDLELTEGEVRWFVEHEMARTVEDVLARRTRALVRDARAAAAAAPAIADLLARLCGYDAAWIEQQVAAFTSLARLHLPEQDDSPL
jgi:glycerol-3-phosphate dehydrogenase